PPLTLADVFPPRDVAGLGLDPERLRTIVATGDVMPGRYSDVTIRNRGDDFLYPVEATKDLLAAADIAVINLEPGYVGTERIAHDMAGFGFTMDAALNVDVPGMTCAYLATHPTPMHFSGQSVNAPSFVVDVGLIDANTLPGSYGPEHWGLPHSPLV
ncbi:MAG: CapA family protein, partial [Chloroflexi bacterium]|nr:CapA family protein [Chloroflexota bacterium]